MGKDSVSHIKKLKAEAQVLLDDHRVADLDEAQLRPFQKFIHFCVLVGKSFVRNRCPVRARQGRRAREGSFDWPTGGATGSTVGFRPDGGIRRPGGAPTSRRATSKACA